MKNTNPKDQKNKEVEIRLPINAVRTPQREDIDTLRKLLKDTAPMIAILDNPTIVDKKKHLEEYLNKTYLVNDIGPLRILEGELNAVIAQPTYYSTVYHRISRYNLSQVGRHDDAFVSRMQSFIPWLFLVFPAVFFTLTVLSLLISAMIGFLVLDPNISKNIVHNIQAGLVIFSIISMLTIALTAPMLGLSLMLERSSYEKFFAREEVEMRAILKSLRPNINQAPAEANQDIVANIEVGPNNLPPAFNMAKLQTLYGLLKEYLEQLPSPLKKALKSYCTFSFLSNTVENAAGKVENAAGKVENAAGKVENAAANPVTFSSSTV